MCVCVCVNFGIGEAKTLILTLDPMLPPPARHTAKGLFFGDRQPRVRVACTDTGLCVGHRAHRPRHDGRAIRGKFLHFERKCAMHGCAAVAVFVAVRRWCCVSLCPRPIRATKISGGGTDLSITHQLLRWGVGHLPLGCNWRRIRVGQRYQGASAGGAVTTVVQSEFSNGPTLANRTGDDVDCVSAASRCGCGYGDVVQGEVMSHQSIVLLGETRARGATYCRGR